MLRVRPPFTVVACLSFLALGSLPLLADVLSPSSRTDASSGDAVPVSRTDVSSEKSVTLSGYVTSQGQTVAIQALNQNTGKFELIDNVPVIASSETYTLPSGASYTIYPWSYSHVYPSQYWSPQNIVPNLTTSQGHLELSAAAGGTALGTFSRAALASMHAALGTTPDPPNAFKDYGDGSTTVVFDRDGVKNPPATQWVNVAGMTSPSPSVAHLSVAWSVGSYTVEGNKTIYALICSPSAGGPYPVVIYNHGGINLGIAGDIGSLHGQLSNDGWAVPPQQPPPPAPPIADDLGQCFDWAKRGWIFAMSSYRGESIYISAPSSQNQNPTLPTGAWHSSGGSEFCLGEITDVLALTHLIVSQTSSIMIGNPSDPVHINADGKLFMYGYSHGGCITYRAFEQGAPVDAFTVIEGFTDLSLNFLNVLGQFNPTPLTPPKHDDTAGRDPKRVPPDPPLTFGDLASLSDNRPPVELRMMTTNLMLCRPYTLPFDNQLYSFKREDFEKIFPARIVKYLVDHSTRLMPEAGEEGEYYKFPPAENLPVVVAARMSLSFPLLISAVPLYARDYTMLGDEAKKLRCCLFSDGGLSSNFPIHFFDRMLPNTPTFGISLDAYDSRRDPHQQHDSSESASHGSPPGEQVSDGDDESRVWMPPTNRAQSGLLLPIQQFEGLFGFLMQLVYAAKDWQDNPQSTLAGSRDRIVHIFLKPEEGGLNINMPSALVGALGGYGAEAGDLLRDSFDLDEHRWRRFLVAMDRLNQAFEQLTAAYDGQAQGPESFSTFLARYDHPLTYNRLGPDELDLLHKRVAELAALGREWHAQPQIPEDKLPKTRANVRIVPEP